MLFQRVTSALMSWHSSGSIHPSRAPGASPLLTALLNEPEIPDRGSVILNWEESPPKNGERRAGTPRCPQCCPQERSQGIRICIFCWRCKSPLWVVRVSHPASGLNPLESREALAKKMKVLFPPFPLRFWAPNFPPLCVCALI